MLSSSTTVSNDQCELCHSTYNLIKKKKLCTVCRQNYCANCAPHDRSGNHSYRICLLCQSISNSTTTKEKLLELKVKHLRCYLEAKNIAHNTCTEKRDLAELIISHRHLPFSRTFLQQSQSSPQSNNRSQEQAQTTRSSKTGPFSNLQQTVSSFANQVNSFASNIQDYVSNTVSDVVNHTTDNEHAPPPPPPPPPRTTVNSANRGDSRSNANFARPPRPSSQASANRPPPTNTQPSASTASATTTTTTSQRKRRKSLSEVNHEDNIEDLNIRELKEILAANFVDYKGCLERSELIDKVRRLYRDRQNEQIKARELNDTTVCDSESCKICMDAIADCVFLDCGHMVTCVKCGKLLAECPICRSNIVRVVRVFKS